MICENESTYSILSVTPAMPLHAVIILKRHVESNGDLSAKEASDLVSAIKKTFEVIQSMDSEKIVGFYKDLEQNPPTKESAGFAQAILADPDILKKPVGYNTGTNVGKEAGQLVNHYHVHLFPIRKQSLGIVTAMRNHYQKQ